MKYTTKEEAMKKATGLDKGQRKELVLSVNDLMDMRRKETDPVKRKEIESQINSKMGWS